MLQRLVAALTLVLSSGSLARAQPAPETPPASTPAPPPSEAEEGRRHDRRLIDEALERLVAGDLAGARLALERAATLAQTLEGRATAALLAERVAALEARRRAAVAPPSTTATAPTPEPGPPPEDLARTPFLVTTSLLGLALWGWALPTAIGLDPGQNTRLFIGSYMTTAAGSFVLPYFLTRAAPPNWGETNLAFYGGTRGAAYGALLVGLIGGEDGFDKDQALGAGLVLGSVGTLLGGYAWAGGARMTPGEARTLALVGDYGILAGLGTGHLLGLDSSGKGDDTKVRGMTAAALGGTVVGIAGGRLLARHRRNTWGDGEVMRAAGIVGIWTGATTAVLFEYTDHSRPLVASLMIGGAVGLGAGDYLVRDTDFTFGQSILVDLSLLTGGLGGAGLTYLIAGPDSPKPYFVSAMAGAGLGLGLSYWVFHDEAPDRRRAGAPRMALVPQLGPGGQRGLGVAGSF